MGMLMTADCEAQSMTDRPAEPVDEPHDDDMEEEVEELLEDAMDADSADASLLQVAEGQPTQVAEASLRLWPPPSWMGVDRWLVRTNPVVNPFNPSQILVEGSTTAIQSAGPATAAEWITHGLGVGAWLIGFTLLCVGAVYLVAFILSALLCLLRSWLFIQQKSLLHNTWCQCVLHATCPPNCPALLSSQHGSMYSSKNF